MGLDVMTLQQGDIPTRPITIRKKITIKTDWEYTHKESSPYKWKVSISPFDADDDLAYINKVHFILHPTFDIPERVKREPPFELTEKGWGEFDMQIIIHFTDTSVPPYDFSYDVRFLDNPEPCEETMTFENPPLEFLKTLDLFAFIRTNLLKRDHKVYEQVVRMVARGMGGEGDWLLLDTPNNTIHVDLKLLNQKTLDEVYELVCDE